MAPVKPNRSFQTRQLIVSPAMVDPNQRFCGTLFYDTLGYVDHSRHLIMEICYDYTIQKEKSQPYHIR